MEGPRVISYIPLHYGSEYLKEAIQSVAPFVEKIVILYTSSPSYGHGTSMQCPESESELKSVAIAASNKVEWHNILASAENHHRGLIYKMAEGYDGILTFDADEVFEPNDIQAFIDYCDKRSARLYGVNGYINFWKSFNHACYDGFRPIRYINLKNKSGQDLEAKCRVYHFSTAQRLEIMRYKLEIHGHKSEIRKNWLDEVYLGSGLNDLHLVSIGLWNAMPFDKNQLPEILKQHPNFTKKVIL